MKVPISISQIIDGLEYGGTIKINNTEFAFNVRFGIPIDKLDEQSPPPAARIAALQHARRLFGITLKKDGQPVEVDDEMFPFLLTAVCTPVVLFYNSESTRSSNDEFPMRRMISGEHIAVKSIGAKLSIGMSSVYDIPDEQIPRRLLEPKQ